jgi:hypothetical protein
MRIPANLISDIRNVAAVFGVLILWFTVSPPSASASLNVRTARVIDIHGRQISSLYNDLFPDPSFAIQLRSIVRAATPHDRTAKVRTLEFRQGDGEPRCVVRTISLERGGGVALPPQHGRCNGRYMEPRLIGCQSYCRGGEYQYYEATGTDPNAGYEYFGEACNLCRQAGEVECFQL